MAAAINYHKFLSDYDLEPTVTSLVRVYEILAHCNYEKQCSIARLNLEILAPILKMLSLQDRKNARLVCRSFKEAIDLHVGMQYVNLDNRKISEAKGKVLCMPPPSASSIRLWSINNSKYLDHLLKRPSLVVEVFFGGQVSLSAFTKITSRCRNLQKIRFSDRSHSYSNIVPMRMQFLHTLDIGCPGYSCDYVGEDAVVPSLWLTYEMLLRRLIAPNLKVLRIFFCCVEECSVLHSAVAQIIRFLAVHNKVKDFSVNIHHRYERFHFLEGDTNYRRFRIDVPKKVLRRLQLEKLHVETMEPVFKVWDAILPGQKFLTHLDVLNKGRRWFYFTRIISNNCATLTVIRLHNISPKRTRTAVLDAGIFENCKVLETLFLSRFANSTQEIVYCYPNEYSDYSFLDTETSQTPEMERLTKLPVTLKNLHIQGLVLSTEEIYEAIPKLQNLQVLELQLCGYHKPQFSEDSETQLPLSARCFDEDDDDDIKRGEGVGVTAKVISAILHHCRKLETFFVEEFENHWTKVRGTDLGKQISKISHVAGDGYFKEGGYYGILICSSINRNSDRLTRTERMHLWGVRLSQYCFRKRGKYQTGKRGMNIQRHERDSVKELSEMDEFNDKSTSDDGKFPDSFSIKNQTESSSCLLEILDKENGQLEKIQRILNADRTPPPATPTKGRTEDTQKIAAEYSNTLFSAIPNFHKASRLELDPTEKFSSFFPRSKLSSRYEQTFALKKRQNSEKSLHNE